MLLLSSAALQGNVDPDSQLNSYLTLRWPRNKATEITYKHGLTNDYKCRLSLHVFKESLLSSPCMQFGFPVALRWFIICFFFSLFPSSSFCKVVSIFLACYAACPCWQRGGFVKASLQQQIWVRYILHSSVVLCYEKLNMNRVQMFTEITAE